MTTTAPRPAPPTDDRPTPPATPVPTRRRLRLTRGSCDQRLLDVLRLTLALLDLALVTALTVRSAVRRRRVARAAEDRP